MSERNQTKSLILKAIDRLHNICNSPEQNEEQIFLQTVGKRLEVGVNGLEAILSPFVDDKYKKEIADKVDEYKKENNDRFNPDETFYFYKWAKLTELMVRKMFDIENKG